jgi:hypothetical protein
MTTLTTSSGFSTVATILVVFGLQLPQKIFFSLTSTERKPGPGLEGVGDKAGVIVSLPIKIGIGIKVAVGWFGSCVGIRTTVDVGLVVGVTDGVSVSMGVNVTVAVAVGAGVFVDGNSPFKGSPAHA